MRNYVKNPEPIALEDATIARGAYRSNFAGKPEKYHPQGGNRNFNIVIDDPVTAERLMNEGYNVHQFKKRDDGEEPDYYLNVKLNYGNPKKPDPKVMIVEGDELIPMTAETVGNLDNMRIEKIDAIISPFMYNYVEVRDNGEKPKLSAYLHSAHVYLENTMADAFDEKYKNYRVCGVAVENPSMDDEDVPF